jgi:hypothetical protein
MTLLSLLQLCKVARPKATSVNGSRQMPHGSRSTAAGTAASDPTLQQVLLLLVA